MVDVPEPLDSLIDQPNPPDGNSSERSEKVKKDTASRLEKFMRSIALGGAITTGIVGMPELHTGTVDAEQSQKKSREEIQEWRRKLAESSQAAMKRFLSIVVGAEPRESDIKLARSVLSVLQEEQKFLTGIGERLYSGDRLFDHLETVQHFLNRRLEQFGTPQERVQTRLTRTLGETERQYRRLPTLTAQDNRADFDLSSAADRASYIKRASAVCDSLSAQIKELEAIQKNDDNPLEYRMWAAAQTKRANEWLTDLSRKIEIVRFLNRPR